jgi:hypothetical protein
MGLYHLKHFVDGQRPTSFYNKTQPNRITSSFFPNLRIVSIPEPHFYSDLLLTFLLAPFLVHFPSLRKSRFSFLEFRIFCPPSCFQTLTLPSKTPPTTQPLFFYFYHRLTRINLVSSKTFTLELTAYSLSSDLGCRLYVVLGRRIINLV